ncbi:alanine- and arginine-rich domain-containing protein isoform 2-T2 [Hipposideros larvatus]
MPGKLRSVVPAMGLGDSGRSREGMPRGPYGVAVRVGLGPPAPREEVPAAYTRLDDLRRRLVRAFQCAVPRGDSRRSPAAAAGEDQSPATFESALAGLRAELFPVGSSMGRGGGNFNKINSPVGLMERVHQQLFLLFRKFYT